MGVCTHVCMSEHVRLCVYTCLCTHMAELHCGSRENHGVPLWVVSLSAGTRWLAQTYNCRQGALLPFLQAELCRPHPTQVAEVSVLPLPAPT